MSARQNEGGLLASRLLKLGCLQPPCQLTTHEGTQTAGGKVQVHPYQR